MTSTGQGFTHQHDYYEFYFSEEMSRDRRRQMLQVCWNTAIICSSRWAQLPPPGLWGSRGLYRRFALWISQSFLPPPALPNDQDMTYAVDHQRPGTSDPPVPHGLHHRSGHSGAAHRHGGGALARRVAPFPRQAAPLAVMSFRPHQPHSSTTACTRNPRIYEKCFST